MSSSGLVKDILADIVGKRQLFLVVVFGKGAFLADGSDDGVAQIGKAEAVFGGNADRLAKPQRIGLVRPASAPRASALLATRTTGLPDLRRISAKVVSSGVRPALASMHEQRDIGVVDRAQRLGAHAALQRLGMRRPRGRPYR
jgi:hypothetical protein